MSLLTHPVVFGAMVEIDLSLFPGKFLVVGFTSDTHAYAVVENRFGESLQVSIELLKVIRPPRHWKQRDRRPHR